MGEVGWGGYQLLVEMKKCGRVGVQCWAMQCEARIMECQEKGLEMEVASTKHPYSGVLSEKFTVKNLVTKILPEYFCL